MNDTMNAVNETIDMRGKSYGDFASGVRMRSNLFDLAEHEGHFRDMVYSIIVKTSRIAVNPDHVDSWFDIAGYSQLAITAITSGALDEDKWAKVPTGRSDVQRLCKIFEAVLEEGGTITARGTHKLYTILGELFASPVEETIWARLRDHAVDVVQQLENEESKK